MKPEDLNVEDVKRAQTRELTAACAFGLPDDVAPAVVARSVIAEDWLDQRDALHKASTQGEWEAVTDYTRYREANVLTAGYDLAVAAYDECGMPRADAEFIADAHEQMPRATAALRAVLALHAPIGGGKGHMTFCESCDGENWPCATHRAVTEALGTDAGEAS